MVVSKDGAVPIASHAYAGNRPDVTQFATAIAAVRSQLAGIVEPDQLTVVFDAGMDSADNLALVADMHFVGSVPPSQHPVLLAVDRSDFVVLDPERLPGVSAFERTNMTILGRDVRVVVTHSEQFHTKQSRGFDQTLAKATARLSELARRLAGGRTRRARRAVEDEIAQILAPRWLTRVLSVELRGTRPKDLRLDFEIDEGARRALEDELFGKRVLITDQRGWSVAEVVEAYRSQWMVEGGFRQLKDPDCVAVAPVFHWTDQKIAVHLFCCVLALSVVRLMVREVRAAGLEMSPKEILEALAGIEETVLLFPSTGGRPRARRMLTELDDTQERLMRVFALDAYAPRS